MQRVTVTLEEELAEAIDFWVLKQGYQNRSEAVRDLVRKGLLESRTREGSGHCVATLTYVYDHDARDLSRRLASHFHNNHDKTLASLHVHLDHDNCLEVAVLKGDVRRVQQLADGVIAERGVRYGTLAVMPVAEGGRHRHAEDEPYHTHASITER